MEYREYEVVLATDQLAKTLRQLSSQRGLYAMGTFRFDFSRQPVGLLVERLEIPATDRTGTPNGASLAPLADWIVVAMPNGDAPVSPREWVDRFKPTFAQKLVVLLLGLGSQRSDWRGWIVHRGEVRALAGLKGIGSHAFQTKENTKDLVENQLTDRWSRTDLALGAGVFERLIGTTVVLIGCSGVGSQIATQLAAVPIRRIGLIDGDVIEAHNLARMPLATEADIGQNKAKVLARRMTEMRSDLAIMVSDKPFGSRMDHPATQGADLIITAVDRDAPRLLASQLSRKRLVPHLDIGTSVRRDSDGTKVLTGDVRFLVPGGGGCISCVGGLRNLEEAEFELKAPRGALPLMAPESWDAHGRLGSLSTLNSVAAATGMQLWLDMLARKTLETTWTRILWENSGWRNDHAKAASGADCKFCKNF